ncbi:MAG: PFL family protein [Chitinispirillia bacterium]|nr:PFL family protein [Chitinispirillia bacterium]MCL2268446.1 PFL family protein [Chitinispirillia bacterium]
MIDRNEILETIEMIEKNNFDVRTITMGISLFDCIDGDSGRTAGNIRAKITGAAKNLVAVGDEIESEYGIPIVNKRISVTPASLLAKDEKGFLLVANALDRAAVECGVNFIGGYTALVHKGATAAEEAFLRTIPEALSSTERLCSSVNVASTRSGINMDAVKLMGAVIRETAELTKDKGAIGCAKFVVFANAVEDNPFMAGAFCGIGEGDRVINVGVSGPGAVKSAVDRIGAGADFGELAECVKKTAFKITRVGQLVAREAAKRLGAQLGIIDLSLAPTPAVGDSVAHILEDMGLESVGAHGTTAALALLNDAVKKGGLMAGMYVGGLSGAFIPVSEDAGMIDAVRRGSLSLEKLEAMTSVCSVGLDMIAVPGDTPAEIISGIIADECAIGVINHKTTAVRIIPAPGKTVGDSIEFGGLLGTAPVMAVNRFSPAVFINRGGKVPAPVISNRN